MAAVRNNQATFYNNVIPRLIPISTVEKESGDLVLTKLPQRFSTVGRPGNRDLVQPAPSPEVMRQKSGQLESLISIMQLPPGSAWNLRPLPLLCLFHYNFCSLNPLPLIYSFARRCILSICPTRINMGKAQALENFSPMDKNKRQPKLQEKNNTTGNKESRTLKQMGDVIHKDTRALPGFECMTLPLPSYNTNTNQ